MKKKNRLQMALPLNELEENLQSITLNSHIKFVESLDVERRCILLAMDIQEMHALEERDLIFEKQVGGKFSGLTRKAKQLAGLALLKYFFESRKIEDTTKALANAVSLKLMGIALDSSLINANFSTGEVIEKGSRRKANPMLKKVKREFYVHPIFSEIASEQSSYFACIENSKRLLRHHVYSLVERSSGQLKMLLLKNEKKQAEFDEAEKTGKTGRKRL